MNWDGKEENEMYIPAESAEQRLFRNHEVYLCCNCHFSYDQSKLYFSATKEVFRNVAMGKRFSVIKDKVGKDLLAQFKDLTENNVTRNGQWL